MKDNTDRIRESLERIKKRKLAAQDQQKSTKGGKAVSVPTEEDEMSVRAKLEEYCQAEGITIDQLLSKSRLSKIAIARRNIARLMYHEEGIKDHKVIAARLKMSATAVWSYLNMSFENNPDTYIEKILYDLPEVYETISAIAVEQERTPLLQVRFILREYCKEK